MADSPKKGRSFSLIFSVAIALIVSLVYDLSVGLFRQKDVGKILGYLADSFTIPGILFICLAALIFAKRQGTFDGLGYGARYAFNSITPQFWLSKDETLGNKTKSYSDYVSEKREKEKNTENNTLTFLLVGVSCLIIGIVLIVIMNKLYPGTKLD
ncbi:MAG: DUF3899 domain-containing protein [Firmicutes bacterium]|nr:DUF3899 domain-containing protein [Candidatus Colimorpha enterica]